MEWKQYTDRDGDIRYVSEDPDPKKLVAEDGLVHYIIREKVSAIYERKRIRTEGEPEEIRPSFTVFIVDGVQVNINIHIDNAYEWWVSWKE